MSCLYRINFLYRNTVVKGSSAILTSTELDDLLYQTRRISPLNVKIEAFDDAVNNLHDYFEPDKSFRSRKLISLSKKTSREVVDELIKIGNPQDNNGNTVAHVLALDYEYRFSFDDIMELGNPSSRNDITLAYIMAGYEPTFSMDELLKIGNLRVRNGNTIAHRMVKHNHKFSVDELLILGNPANDRDVTVADVMMTYGHVFTDEEKKLLNISK